MSSQRALVQVLCARKWPICEYQVFGDRKTKCRELLGMRRCEQNVLPRLPAKCPESLETLVGRKKCSKTSENERLGTAGNCWGEKDARKRPNAKCRELPGRRKMLKNIWTRTAGNCRELPGREKMLQNARTRNAGTARADKNASTKCGEWLGNARESQKA